LKPNVWKASLHCPWRAEWVQRSSFSECYKETKNPSNWNKLPLLGRSATGGPLRARSKFIAFCLRLLQHLARAPSWQLLARKLKAKHTGAFQKFVSGLRQPGRERLV
jgi:hypothetical protein